MVKQAIIRMAYDLDSDMRERLISASMRNDVLVDEMLTIKLTTDADLGTDGDPVLEKYIDNIMADHSNYTVEHDVEVNVSRDRVQVVCSMEIEALREFIDER